MISTKTKLTEAQYSKDNLERTQEFHDKLIREDHDNKVMKQAMTNAIESDYARGLCLRHYKKLPPIPLDETSEAIRELKSRVSFLELDKKWLQTDLDRCRWENLRLEKEAEAKEDEVTSQKGLTAIAKPTQSDLEP